MANEVENARKNLEADLSDNPYILDDPMGYAITNRKLKEYFFICVIAGEDRVDCKDWLYHLYGGQTDEEKYKFALRVDMLVNALYDFYSYIQNIKRVRHTI